MGKSLQSSMQEVNNDDLKSLIQLFLDGEASQEQVKYIEEKCQSCEQTAAIYNYECSMLELIKKHLGRAQAPTELIQDIRYRIEGAAPSSL